MNCVLQCGVLQCYVVCCRRVFSDSKLDKKCVAVCCSLLQCVAGECLPNTRLSRTVFGFLHCFIVHICAYSCARKLYVYDVRVSQERANPIVNIYV